MTKNKQFTAAAVRNSKEVIAEQRFKLEFNRNKKKPFVLRRLISKGGGLAEDWQPMMLAPIEDSSGEDHPAFFQHKVLDNYSSTRADDQLYHNFKRSNGQGGLQVRYYYNAKIHKAATVEQPQFGGILRFYNVEH